MLIATIVSHSYLPQARVLTRSFLAHNPGGRAVALILDPPVDHAWDEEPFEVLTLDDLAVEPRELRLMTTMYTVAELSNALKPFLLRHLVVDRGEEAATYLDSDIEVFGSLDAVDAAARQHSLVLTPHRPGPLAPWVPPVEFVFALAGSYNAGCVAVSHAGVPFLDWWSDRCRRECIDAQPEGLCGDQRWLDLAASYFPHDMVREPGYNTGYWNLDRWPLRFAAGRGDAPSAEFEVGGAPLRFFHFSGFDPDHGHLLTAYQGARPWILLSGEPALRELCARYAARLEEEGRSRYRAVPYGFATAANGMRIDRAMRRVFRQEVLRRERAGHDVGAVGELPDPFDPAQVERFVELLRTPFPDSDAPRISRYLHRRYLDRPDLQQGFPDLRGAGGNHFLWWVREMGHRELDIPAELVPAADEVASDRSAEPSDGSSSPVQPGVRLVGDHTAPSGAGAAVRGFAAALAVAGEPYVALEPTDIPTTTGDIDVLCVPPDRLAWVLDRLGPRFTSVGHTTVGAWMWGEADFPTELCAAAELVDEVWASSEHAAQAIRGAFAQREIATPVHVVPPPVVKQPPAGLSRAELGLPDGFVFVAGVDFRSGVERQNPAGVVAAFCRAFAPGEGPRLVIKTVNGWADAGELERLRVQVLDLGRGGDVQIRDQLLEAAEQQALIAACDAYVSLHRASGFGFALAEAMLLGKPVIATACSGHLELVDADTGYLVDVEPTATGAEPDLDEAARLMRQLVADPDGAAAVAERGRRAVLDRHSPAARGPLLAERLAALRARAEPGPPNDGRAPTSRGSRWSFGRGR